MEINQRFIPASNTKTRPGIKMVPKYITIHETDNTAAGANDEAHAGLQANGNSRTASWHYQVDDNSIWQSLPDNEVGWHAGDGRGPGNYSSIAIEICVNSDGNYLKACENAAWLTKHLMDKHGISLENVVQHNKWSGKNCPRHLRAGDWGIAWGGFISLVQGQAQPAPAPVVTPVSVKQTGDPFVRFFQDWLNKLIGAGLTVDGFYGPKTKTAAIKAFQTMTGSTPDGIWGPKTKANADNIRLNAVSNLVGLGQGMLHINGYGVAGDDFTVFGQNTANAAMRFQKDRKLAQDAIIGKNTWEALFRG